MTKQKFIAEIKKRGFEEECSFLWRKKTDDTNIVVSSLKGYKVLICSENLEYTTANYDKALKLIDLIIKGEL